MSSESSSAGVMRSHAPSRAEKRTFIAVHGLSLLGCTFVAFGMDLPNPSRAKALVLVAALYFLRHAVTLFYLLARKVAWGEVLGLVPFMAAFEIGFVWLGGQSSAPFGGLDALGLGLLGLGSYLNTGSEVQRKWWKADPANKGHCYTLGLFGYAMHINFFGDVVLFSGWALLTANLWALALPLMMALMFIFLHIPGLDTYLAKRYGDEFTAYAAKTKKLVPFVY